MKIEELVQQDITDEVAVFSALADPTRLRLVKLLGRQSGPDALCVNALAALLEMTQSAVSQHLRILKAIGLVKGERRGYHIHYFINWDVMGRYRELILAALPADAPVGEVEPCTEECPMQSEEDVLRG